MTTPERYVYTLSYPPQMGGAVFYVGRGQWDRVGEHERMARNGHAGLRYDIIRSIWLAGYEVVKDIPFRHADDQLVMAEEQRLILEIGLENLTNSTAGGEGFLGSNAVNPLFTVEENGKLREPTPEEAIARFRYALRIAFGPDIEQASEIYHRHGWYHFRIAFMLSDGIIGLTQTTPRMLRKRDVWAVSTSLINKPADDEPMAATD